MTKTEFLHLGDVPKDIKKREARIKRLEEIIASEGTVSDTVQSSTNAGNATIIGHATVTGHKSMGTYHDRLCRLHQGLADKNALYKKNYIAAVNVIETVEDPALRVALHLRCVEGYSWDDIAGELGHGSAESWKMAVHRFCDIWFKT